MRTSLWILAMGAIVGMAITGCGRKPSVAGQATNSADPAQTFGFLAKAQLGGKKTTTDKRGAPVVIYTYWLHIRLREAKSAIKAELTSGNGWRVTDSTEGPMAVSADEPGAIVMCNRKDAPKGSPHNIIAVAGKFPPYDPTSGNPKPEGASKVLDIAWTTLTVMVFPAS